MKKKSKGGKRAGAGRPKMPEAMETVSIRVKTSDVKRWGGRDKLRVKLCEFVAFSSSFNQVSFFEPGKGIVDVRDLKEGEIIPPAKILITTTPEAVPKVIKSTKQSLSLISSKDLPDPGTLSIVHQIAAIKAEKIPKERDTIFGRKSWALEQKKRIEELEKQLK
jgi:hypothetical protein